MPTDIQLTGKIGADTAIILTIGGATTAKAGHAVSPTVTVTLTDHFPNTDPGSQVDLSGIHLIATDANHKHATADIKVHVIDDVPTAVPDTDSIPAGEYGPATGNVITDNTAGDAGDSDNGADTPGADGITVVGVEASTTAGTDGTDTSTVGVQIQGQWGKLTLMPMAPIVMCATMTRRGQRRHLYLHRQGRRRRSCAYHADDHHRA